METDISKEKGYWHNK